MKRKSAKRFKNAIIATLALLYFVCGGATPLVSAAATNNIQLFAAACEPGDKSALPTDIFVPWYQYLEGEDVNGKCRPVFDDDLVATVSKIALAVIDTLIRLASLLALGYVIYGSIRYVTSGGDSSGVAGAKTTIANALIGLVIALLAIGIVQYIGNVVR